MISTSHSLARELLNIDDDFITVKVNGEEDREYIIESIIHEKKLYRFCDNSFMFKMSRWRSRKY